MTGRPARRRAGPAAPPRPELSARPRRALWDLAGFERDGDGLSLLRRDPHPLARLIATAALTRRESRGAHQRTDFPSRTPAWTVATS